MGPSRFDGRAGRAQNPDSSFAIYSGTGADMLALLALVYKVVPFLRCAHRFSWPQTGADGQDYQVCLRCGARYRYDWNSMRQVGKAIMKSGAWN
jgi:hypothetical protein